LNFENGECYFELRLTSEQRDAVSDIFYAHARAGAKMAFVSTIAPDDQGLWTLQILTIDRSVARKFLGVIRREVRQKDLIFRIRRVAPDVALRMSKGEFRSVRSAAIAAGLVKVRSPLDQLRAAWRKLSDQEKCIFSEEVMAWQERGGAPGLAPAILKIEKSNSKTHALSIS
jgi:hypothetical protein